MRLVFTWLTIRKPLLIMDLMLEYLLTGSMFLPNKLKVFFFQKSLTVLSWTNNKRLFF